jgi:SprB repeat
MNKFTKKIMLLLGCVISFCASAQNLVTPISINIPANPPANTAEWATTLPPVMILAQTKPVNGVINGLVQDSRILVTIKSGGSKVCGTYTPQTAPMSGFNSPSKNWKGTDVLSLLGQECTLKPGSYELCVQFYTVDAAVRIIGETCKPFTIADKKEKETYTPPQNIFPNNNKVFTEKETKLPIVFRWTPIIPKPKASVTYKLRVWEMQEGQSATQAIKMNTPLLEKDVKAITQSVEKITFPPCSFNGSCGNKFTWNVQASKQNQMGEVELLGASEPASFGVVGINQTPAVASCTLSISSGPCLTANVGLCGAVPGGGQATITGGTAPYSTTSLGASINGNTIHVNAPNEIPAGGGSVTITDAAGCSASAIIQSCPKYDPVQFTLGASHQDATCATINDGSITASFIRIGVGGGPSPVPNPQSYTVSGYPPTVFGPVTKPFGTSVTGLAPGTYIVIGGGSSCWNTPSPSSIQTIAVASATCPCTLSISNQNPNYGTIGDFCGKAAGGGYGFISGSATSTYTITSPKGTIITYPISGIYVGAPSIAQNPYCNITYVPVSIIDNAGCTATATLTVYPEFSGISHHLIVSQQNVTSTCLNDGSINATFTTTGVPGGNVFNPAQAFPQTYTVIGTGGTVFGPVTKNFGTPVTGLAAGTYMATGQSSGFNCWFAGNTSAVTITAPTCAPLVLTTSLLNSSLCTMKNGKAKVTATGGTGTYTYSWNTIPAQTNPIRTTAIASNLAPGNYTVTVASGINSQSTIVNIPHNVQTLNVSLNTFQVGFYSKMKVLVNNVNAPSFMYSFSWSNGQNTNPIPVYPSHPPVPYSVMVASKKTGCTGTATMNY